MEHLIAPWFAGMSPLLLAAAIVVTIMALGKAADWLVDEAVALSEKSRVPKVIIGATIVSLGTTTPEAAVSVLAAVQGNPGMALGNAVGSIICDTGLILGLASILAPLPLNRQMVNRQGWIQVGVVVALVVFCWPLRAPSAAWTAGGTLTQPTGFIFLIGLAVYIGQSIRWARRQEEGWLPEAFEKDVALPTGLIVLRLLASVGLLVISATLLIGAVTEAARRLAVPESIIAATLVAFGTSLPELVTAVKASLRGHGELAVGNVIGADILNVLFVAGAAAAATSGGLVVEPHFFRLFFPTMLFVVFVFRIGIAFSGDSMKRPFGVVLIAAYAFATLASYLVPS